jgi:hypothetical protein
MKISKLKSLLVALAAVAAIPSAMAKGNGPNSGLPAPRPFVPNLYPFLCNIFVPTPVTGFSGYINIAGVRGLVIDLQTEQSPGAQIFGDTCAGTFTLPAIPNVRINAHNRFTGLSFGLQGYCNNDGCSGPWVFVQGYDINGNPMVGANVVCASNFEYGFWGNCEDFGYNSSSFTTQSFNNASFGFPATGVSLAGVIIQLFPGCDSNHDTRMCDLLINGQHAALEQPRSVYNYCPLGFNDPRPAPCNVFSNSGGD